MHLNEIVVADSADAWSAAGFQVINNCINMGNGFRIRLNGATTGGMVSFCLGSSTQSRRQSHTLNGMTVELDAATQSEPPAHTNTVNAGIKSCILTDDRDACIARLRTAIPELGEPPIIGVGPDPENLKYAIWSMDNVEVGLEVVAMDSGKPHDVATALFLQVDDMDAAIAAFGPDNVTKPDTYMGRVRVKVKPKCGITAGMHLLATA